MTILGDSTVFFYTVLSNPDELNGVSFAYMTAGEQTGWE